MIKVFKNFIVNVGNVFRRPLTVNFPKERIVIPEGSKGMIHIKLDLDTLEIICEGCGQCAEICPKKCIIIKKDKQGKGGHIADFVFDAGRCTFCGNCIEACRLKAMDMSYKYQLAELNRKDLLYEKLDLIRQTDYTIKDFWSKQ